MVKKNVSPTQDLLAIYPEKKHVQHQTIPRKTKNGECIDGNK